MTNNTDNQTPAHAVATDKGRNVHCICGAEYSLMKNLMRHIDAHTN